MAAFQVYMRLPRIFQADTMDMRWGSSAAWPWGTFQQLPEAPFFTKRLTFPVIETVYNHELNNMLPKQVSAIVGKLPYMSLSQGKLIYDLIVSYDRKKLLELGFYHGVSTSYMAGALQALDGSRTITTIDLLSAKDRQPNVEALLEKAGLRNLAEIFYEPRSYNWRLMKFIEEGRSFDFCYLDGGHNWYDSGYAFFLIDKILEPGGLILFDDLYWSAEKKPWAKGWPEEERKTQGVLKVWELLVLQHPNYEKVWVKKSWGLARKKA